MTSPSVAGTEIIAQSPAALLFAVVVFLAYTALLVYFGYDGWRRSRGLRDFLLGGGRLNGWWVGISFGATYASANMFMGVPAMGYTHGTAALWWSSLGFGLPFIALVLFANRFWHFSRLNLRRDATLAEWLGHRFQSPLLRVGTGLLSLFLVFYVMGQVIGAATLFERIFGLNYAVGAFLTLALVTAYTAMGGMRSTILTDFVQGVVMLGIALVTFASLSWVFDTTILEAPAAVVHALGHQDASLVTLYSDPGTTFAGPVQIIAVSWLLFAFILMPHLMNRILVLDDALELRRMILGAGISLWGMSVFMIWAGIAGRVLFPHLEVADAVIPVYIAYAFPDWLAIIIVVGILSAILTTADSLMHAISTVVANDIYRHGYLKFRGIDHTGGAVDLAASWVARLTLALVAVVAFIGALQRPDSLFLLTQVGIAGLLSGVSIPLILGYSWRGISRRGAELGFLAGFLTFAVLFFGGLTDGSQFEALLAASGVSLSATLLGSYTSPAGLALVEKYDRAMSAVRGG